jgi:hypothetical protein
MRHSDPGGRFTIPWEHQSIFTGIDADLRAPVGMHVQWIVFDPDASETDVIYDVGNQTVGRQWKEPIRVPAFGAFIYQGITLHNDRGFYNTDVLRVSVAMHVMEELLPDVVWEPDEHIKDRVLFRGHIYIPTRIYLRGALRDQHTVFTIDANQINSEEWVNDPQLSEWARRDIQPPQPFDPQRHREHSTL